MFTKTTRFFAIIAIATSVLFLSACSHNDDITSNIEQVLSGTDLAISDPQIKKEIDFMKSKNIITESTYQKWLVSNKSDIIYEMDVLIDSQKTVRHDEFYMLPNEDVLTDRKQIQDEMSKQINNQSSRMKRAANMFASSGGTITCRIITTGTNAVPLAWRQALSEAVLVWNNRGLKVKFATATASNTNIVGGYINVFVSDANSPTKFAVTAPINSPGYFSEAIIITKTPNNMPDINGKKFTMIHELGHAIGLMHTEDAANNSNIFNSAVTCNESNNVNSFMYGSGSSTQLFTDFSTCDKQNLQYYWGYGSTIV